MHQRADPAHFMVMSIESQHEQFVRDIRAGRAGRAHAADLVGRYEPFTTSTGCVTHMFIDDDKCSDCARRARERNEDRQVDRFRDELWREQRDYDAEVARDQADQAKKDQAKADRDACTSKLWESNRKSSATSGSSPRSSVSSSGRSSGRGTSGLPPTRVTRTKAMTLGDAQSAGKARQAAKLADILREHREKR